MDTILSMDWTFGFRRTTVSLIKGIAETLRKNLTDSKRELWKYLRAKQLGDLLVGP